MSKSLKILLCLLAVAMLFNFGTESAYAADNNYIFGSSFGLSSIDSDVQRVFRGVTRLARPIVTIMTALAGMMVVLNIGGDHKQKIWNWILGIGLALNFGSVLWHMWGGYANIPAGITSAEEYSLKVFNSTDLKSGGVVDILSTFMKYYLTFIVSGAEAIKPIGIKLLLALALADMSIRLALDLTDKDKISWLVKTFLKIGFYVFLINNWLGIGGLNLMDSVSKGFQEIGFIAGNYRNATLTSITEEGRDAIDAKDKLAPDSIVNNTFKIFDKVFAIVLNPDAPKAASASTAAGNVERARTSSGNGEELSGDDDYQQVLNEQGGPNMLNALKDTTVGKIMNTVSFILSSPFSAVILAISLLIFVIVSLLAAVEMFMARIEFYTLALLGIPLLAFGVIKHFEYLAQNAIRAVFNCGVKVCCIAFLQAVICQMFSKYTSELVQSMNDNRDEFTMECIFIAFQLMLMSIIMYLIISKIPKLIQGLLSGNPSMSGSDMTGTAMGVAGTAASAVGTVAGARAAAASAKMQAQPGSSNWKMSTLGQLGATMLAKAPITSSAYGSYAGVQNMGWNSTNENQRQNQGSQSPPSTPSEQNQQNTDNPQGNGGTQPINSESTPPVNQGNPPPAPPDNSPPPLKSNPVNQDTSSGKSDGGQSMPPTPPDTDKNPPTLPDKFKLPPTWSIKKGE